MNILSLLLFKAKLIILAIPLVITMTGAGLNQAVLISNGGKFPVMINEVWAAKIDGEFLDDYHCRMTAQTHLNFLADYITFHVVVMSPGDLLIGLGETLAAYALTVWMTVIVMETNRLYLSKAK